MRIRYQLSEDEWIKSSQMRYDNVAPTYYCFNGRVSILGGHRSLFGRAALELSVADLACALAEFSGIGFPGVGSNYLRFEEGEGRIVIVLAYDEQTGRVTLKAEGLGHAVLVDRDEFVSGVRAFLMTFASDLSRHVEDPFGWADLSMLAPYAPPR